MSKKNKKEWISFTEDGQRWMICKHCQSEYVQVDEDTSAITCSTCVIRKTLALKDEAINYFNASETFLKAIVVLFTF